ncbi:tar RNA-binding protein, putative, partial [Ixodes scapularis]
NQKTPISILQELCARNCLTPEYKLLSVEGAVHAPTFMYRLLHRFIFVSRYVSCKRENKCVCAKAATQDRLASNGGVPAATTPTTTPAAPGVPAVEEDGIPGNPVGALQELCMKLRWRPPFYETVIEEGLPHERTFGISCLVNNLSEMGKGKSKRLAKRQAAYKMIQLIENQVGQLLRQLQGSDGARLGSLQGTPLNTAGLDYVGLLREIADEQSFEVTYVPIDELSTDGKHQCLVQLTSLPLAVCFGTAESPEQARAAAARSALQYLKIMTKK